MRLKELLRYVCTNAQRIKYEQRFCWPTHHHDGKHKGSSLTAIGN